MSVENNQCAEILLATAGLFVQSSRSLDLSRSKRGSMVGLPDTFGTQVNILADDEDIKFTTRLFCTLSLIFTDISRREPTPRCYTKPLSNKNSQVDNATFPHFPQKLISKNTLK